MQKEEKNEIMTIGQVAKFLKIKTRTIYRLANNGEIPAVRIGGQWRFSREAIRGMFLKK